MQYAIVRRKKGKGYWALVCREGGRERTVQPGTAEYAQFGLDPKAPIEQAREQFKLTKPLRQAMWTAKVRARNDAEKARAQALETAYLPRPLVEAFERDIVPGLSGRAERWLIVKRLIAEIPHPPQDWFEREALIFGLFEKRRWNIAYVSRLLTFFNKWGAYYCRRMGTSYLPLERPQGLWKQRIMRAYNEGLRTGAVPNKETAPLRIEDLAALSRQLDEAAYAGLYLMFWLGLRQRELRQLLERTQGEEPGGWWIEKTDERFPAVLHVYQDKLKEKGIKDALCWKCIPFTEPEQLRCVGIIEGRKFKVPPGLNTRRARLGFSILMEERGYLPTDVQDWLGHIGRSTRDKYYKERRRAVWHPPVTSRQRVSGE